VVEGRRAVVRAYRCTLAKGRQQAQGQSFKVTTAPRRASAHS